MPQDAALRQHLLEVLKGGNAHTTIKEALDDVPADVREQMSFHPVMSIGEVLDLALEPAPTTVAV